MRRSTSIIAAGSIALLGVAVLAGCSSSSSPAPAASASTAASNAQVLPPVMVAEDVTTATAKVGEFVVIQVTKPDGSTYDLTVTITE